MSTLRAAEEYICRGFAVVPVPHGKKGPILKGWEDLRLTLEELPQYFNGRPQNVGLILGNPSGGLVDVDLDAEEAAKVAGRFLPPTLTSGRESSPHSPEGYPYPVVRNAAGCLRSVSEHSTITAWDSRNWRGQSP